MQAKSAILSVVSSVALSFISTAALAGPPTIDKRDRGAIVADLMQSWQQRINTEKLATEDPRNWAMRNAAKFARLTDAQLAMAQQATTLGELELLFITAPVPDGTSLGALMANPAGNMTVVPHVAKPGALEKASPAGSPDLYADLVFTAVTPCRIYDSRGAPGYWTAGTTHIVDTGPHAGGYAFQGGQATNCAGSLAQLGQIASVMTAVSTAAQTGPGYLIFFPDGAPNPNPYGVAQWFQPGYVQTSFVVMPTDLITTVYSDGYIGNAGSHVIIDMIGYFAKSRSLLTAAVNSDGSFVRGAHATSSSMLSAGNYQVNFDRDVSACSYTATLGPAFAGPTPTGGIAAAPRSATPTAVFVNTFNVAGTSTSAPFHLKVQC